MKFFDLDLKLSNEVYVPREDTYLLVEATRDEVDREDEVLDMGTGTGILALIAAKDCEKVVGVDVDKKALELAKENARRNDIENVEFVQSDLFEEVDGKFDLVVFNPPYLPGEVREENFQGSEQWFGGETGREVIGRFSEELDDHLSGDGRALVMVSSLTGFEETREMFTERGFTVTVKEKKKIPWETLYVLKLS